MLGKRTVNQQIARNAKIAKDSDIGKAAVSICKAISTQQSAKTQNNDVENVIALRPSRGTRLEPNIDTFCHCFAHEYVVV